MKKVLNLVKKRKSSSQSSDDARSTGGGDAVSLGRASRASSTATATSSVLQFQRARSLSQASHLNNIKYNIDTGKGRDKSMTKLHIAVWNEDVDKAKKYIKQSFQPDDSELQSASNKR